jgi:hypothetical protein
MVPVVRIAYRGVDINGRAYVGFYTAFGENGTLSGSYKEGELVRTVPLCSRYTSHELDVIERRAREERTLDALAEFGEAVAAGRMTGEEARAVVSGRLIELEDE